MDKKYLNIPVSMLKVLYTDSAKFFNDVFDVGIYLYSQTLNGTEEEKYSSALKFFNVKSQNIIRDIANAKRVLKGIPEKCPFAGIETGMLFDYYKNEKSEFEVVCLGVFLAIKSILGKKVYTKTNKALIHARMFGYVSPRDVPATLNLMEAKYNLRWHMDKVLIELQMHWYLKLYAGHQRGMYLSFNLELPKLVEIVEKSKQKKQVADFKALRKAQILSVTKNI